MRPHTREELHTVAGIHRDADHHPLTRDERVARWAELLEQDPDRALVTLQETEYQADIIRDEMREDGSPITIAFKDPVLRGEGLTNDSYGEAKRFFEFTDCQLHYIVCSCHSGVTVRGDAAAERVRDVAKPHPGLIGMLWDALLIFR